MYHSDPNINLALERQADRVRAIQAVGQSGGRAAAELAQPSADLPARPLRGRLRRRWPAMAALILGLTLALVAWSGGANGALIGWGW